MYAFCWLLLHVYTKIHGWKNSELQLYTFFELIARRIGWSTPRLGRLTPGKTRTPL